MANYLQHVLEMSKKHQRTIQRLCRPVVEHLAIDYVAYQSVKADGTCVLAINRVEFGEFYLENKTYNFDPFIRHPQHIQSGLLIADYLPHQQYKTYVQQAKKRFAWDVVLTLIEKKTDSAEYWCFAAKKQNNYQLFHYLNEIQLFKQFAHYFLQAGKAMYRDMQEEPVELIPLLGDQFFQPSLNLQTFLPSQKKAFLKRIAPQVPLLTHREKACLLSLLEGHTAKQTAQQLNLSFRTIEQFIDKIKRKFQCQHKRELIKVARQLHEVGEL